MTHTANFFSGTVSVITSSSPLAVTTESLPSATLGERYSAIVAATGGTSPSHFSLASGSLPTSPTAAGSARYS